MMATLNAEHSSVGDVFLDVGIVVNFVALKAL